MGRKWKRRNYFIKKDMQGKYIFTVFLFAIFGCLLLTFIFSRLSANTLTITYTDSVLKIDRTPIVLAKEMLKANWIFILTGGFFIGFLALFVTHRFAGPLYRFEETLNGMIEGDHSFVIRLRTHDEGKECAGMLNLYNEKISGDIKELRETAQAIRDCLQAATKASDPGEVSARIAEASGLSERLHDRLGAYKLKNDA